MSKRMPVHHTTHQFLAVAAIGHDADYRSEVRHQVAVELPFRLTNRSGVRQLILAYRQVRKQLVRFSIVAFDVWLLCPETGLPCLFVSGLIDVKQGRLSKSEANALDLKIRPQITEPQPSKTVCILLNATVHTWGCSEFYDEDADDDEREFKVFDGIFGCFDHCELIDSDLSDEYDVYVSGNIWHQFMLELPFCPGKNSSLSQLRHIVRKAVEQIESEIFDVEIDDLKVWMLDDTGKPCECISGWMRVNEGDQTTTEMKRQSRRCLQLRPQCTEAWSA